MTKNLKKRIAMCLTVATMLTGAVGVANAVSVEGGEWNYGVNSVVFSNYYHPSQIHGSSVINGDGLKVTDYNKAAGKTSYASAKAARSGNQAFYCIGRR